MNNPVDESGEGAGFEMTADTNTAIKKALLTDAEPVAWLVKIFADSGILFDTRLEWAKPTYRDNRKAEFVPLYATPPAPSIPASQTLVNLATAVLGQAPATANEFMSISLGDIRSALSAQVQDVAGWKLVPLDDEGRCIADSALPHEMIEAGIRVQEQVNDDNSNYVAGETTDWDCGMVAVAIYRAMLAAAPAAKQDIP